MATADKGVWLDKESGKVVRKEPARGRLLVAPGDEITDDVQATIDRYEDNYANFEQATAPADVETREASPADEPAKKATKAAAKKDA